MSDQAISDQGASPQVGALLRASRLRVGDDLRDVADVLRIRYLYLEAIEECRYDDLPGETYAVGFIRSYAEHLGLDGEEIVRRFRAEEKGSKRANDLSFPTPVQESGVPKGAVVFVGVVLALIIYGGWYMTTTDEDFFSDLITPVPDRLQHMVDGDEATSPPVVGPDGDTGGVATTPNGVTSAAQQAEAEVTSQATPAPSTDAANEVSSEVGAGADVAVEAGTSVAEENQTDDPPAGDTVVAEIAPSAGDVAPGTVAPPASEPSLDEVQEQTDAVTSDVASVTETPTDGSNDATVEEAETGARSAIDQVTSESESAASDVSASDEGEAEPGSGTEALENTATPPQADEAAATTASAEEVSAPTSAQSITADDLNALSLRAATGQDTPASSTEPTAPEPAETAVAEIQATETAAIADEGIVIRAVDDSWVEITSAQGGEIIFTGVMSAGDTFNVPPRDDLLLATGNAGVLEFFVDGESVPNVGGIGAVRRGVTLDAVRLRDGTASDR